MRNFYKNLKTLILLAFLFLGFVNVWAAGLPYNTTMTKNHYNNSSIKVGSDGLTYSQNKWDGGVFLQAGEWKNLIGSIKGEEWNWDDKYVIIAIETNSVPYQLEFKYATNSIIASNAVWYVSESSDNKNWTQKWTVESNSTTKSSLVKVDLSKSTKYIKLCYSGNYGGIYSDIKVTDQAYVHNPKVNDEEISSLDFGTGTISSGKAELTFDVEWCNVNTLSVTSSNATYFTVSPASFGQTTKYGTQTVTVYYDRDKAVGNHSGTITISNGTAKYTKAVTVSGSTTKRPQEIHWNEDLVASNYTLNAEESLTGSEVATADNEDGEITYFSNNTSVIAVSPDGKTLSAVSNGTAVITVTSTGSELYDEGEDSKTFTVTSKKKQIITWTDQLLGLKTNAKPNYIDLTATATSNGPITYAIEGGSASCITLSGTNNSRLTITGTPGEAYIIATQAGGDEWIEATTRKKVTVRDPNAACDEYALADESFTFNSGIKDGMVEQQFALTGTPTQLTFTAKRGNLRYAWSEQQDLFIEQYANFGSGLEWRQVTSIKPETSNKNYGPFAIDGTATKIRFYSGEYAQQQVTNISIPRKKELSVSTNSITEDAERNVKWSKTISVTRSNIDIVDLSVVSTDTDCPFVLNKTSLGTDCADMSTESFEVSFTPHQKGKTYTGTITITDGKANPTTQTISLSVTSVAFNQAIKWNFEDNQEFYTTHETLTLDATTDATGLEVSYRLADGEDAIATLNGNSLFFIGSGTIHVTAYQEGNDKYNAAENVTKTIVIKPDTPHIATNPTGTSIKYLQNLNTSTLSGGSADITLRGANTAVAGSFAWTSPNYQVVEAAGSHSYGVTFTPSNTGMYTTTTGSVSITVNKADQAIVMNNCSIKVAVTGLDANAADSKVDLDTLVQSQTTDPVNNNRTGAVTYEVIGDNKANATIATGNIFSATAIGTYTIRATKAETDYYNKTTDEFTVTVTRRTNTLTVVGKQTKYVGQEVTGVASVVNSDAAIQTSSTDATIAYYDKDQNKIIIPNSEAKSFDETTVYITIWQNQNDQFLASGEKTIEVKVKKYNNALTCSWGEWTKTAGFNQAVGVTFNSNNHDTSIEINQINGHILAEYRPSSNDIQTSHHVGQATWTVSQAETYKYKAATMQFLTLNIGTETSDICYMYSANPDATASSVGQIVLPEVGTAGMLYLKMKNNGFGTKARLTRVVGTTETTEEISVNAILGALGYVEVGPFELDRNTTVIRFDRGGYQITGEYTDDPYIDNIRITRVTWLKTQNANKQDIDTLFMPVNTVNKISPNSRTAKFYVDYSTCASEIVVVSNNPHITVSNESFNSTVAGRKEITVTYSHNAIEQDTAQLTIYTPYENKVLNVVFSTVKENQTLSWKEGYEAANLSLPVDLTVVDAATASSGNQVTYTTNRSDIIQILEDGHSFKIIGEGTATLTAHADGDDTQWNEITETKTITTTDKKIQLIVWDQSFTRLHEGDVKDLEAVIMIQNYASATSTMDPERSALITYSCPENNVISISGNQMTVTGVGETTITAQIADDSEDYEPAAPVTLPVIVRQQSTGDCATPLMYQKTSETEIFAFDLSRPPVERVINIGHNHTTGDPDKLTFCVRGVPYKTSAIGQEHFEGDIYVYESTDGGNTWSNALGMVDAESGKTKYTETPIQLNPNTTHLKFVRPKDGEGRHYIGDIQITRLPYIKGENADPNVIAVYDLGNVMAGASRSDAATFEYASVKGGVVYALDNSTNNSNVLTLNETEYDFDCGAFGEHAVPFTFQPMVVGAWSEDIVITDALANMSGTIRVTANVTQGTQQIIWNPTTGIIDFEEPPLLDGYATSGLPVSYAVTSGTNVARIEDGQVIILKSGSFTITASQDGDANFLPAENVEKTFTVNISHYVYNGDGDWDDTDNWNTHEAPTEPKDVTINGNVTINTEVEVNSLTIEQGAQVTLTVNGQLTVGSGNSEYRENYGDLHVENEGHVILGSGELKVNDFILDASLADIVESQSATSGQVTNPASLDVTGAAYFDLAFDPDGQVTFGWYDFTVPFEVNISNGIYRLNDDGSTTPMRSGSEFLIYRYDEAKRATGTKGWVNAGAVLNAGEAYTITLDYEMVKNVVRFVWNGNNSLGASYNCAVTRSETGDDTNRGWNGLGNGTLTHTELQSLPAQTKVQMYDHGTKAYKPVEAASYTYAVGTAFFYQVPNTDDVILSPAEKALPMRAPQREVRTVDEFRLSLKTADTEREQDVMWVSASEDATTEYTVGHDLLKMTSLSDTKIAQMWVACGGLMLCDAEMPLTNNNASFPLEFYAPQAGSYSVAIERSPEDATLFLTYDGRIIWNLSMSAYPLELQKGTTQGYGLRLVADRQTTTDFEQTEATMQGVKKVLIDDQLYLIMPDGAIYTAEGKKVNE